MNACIKFLNPIQTLSRVLTVIFFGTMLLLAFSGRPASAQQDVGHIGGTVTDSGGNLIVGAKIHINNDATDIAQDVTSNSSGYYQSQPLAPGRYTVTISSDGFKASTIKDIVVDAASNAVSNAQLEIGSTTETITVEATPPALDSVDAQIGNTVDTRAVQELPVNGRSALALATLSPGVVSAAGATNQGFVNRGLFVSAIRISGGVPGGNNNLLDGVSNLQSYLGEVAINIKADSVQEFRIMSGVIPAQFGYTSGGVINVITRSGANQFHGSLYEFFRNDALDARTALPFSTVKPELRYNNYGGTLGGPIIHDRAFFFGNYEEYRYITAAPAYYTVPTLQERTGDFSDVGRLVGGTCRTYGIYDPETGSSTTQRTAFGNNQIPTTRQDQVALNALGLLVPAPNNTVGAYDPCTHANNYLAAPRLKSNERTVLGRVDYRVSQNDSLFARYAYYLNFTDNGSGFGGPFYSRNDTLQNYDAMLDESHIFSPTMLNDFRIAVLRSDFPFQAATANQDYAGKIGLPGVGPEAEPVLSITGLPVGQATVGFRASTTIELLDDVAKTIGSHTLHIGYDGRFVEGYNLQAGNASGRYTFTANQTAQGTSSGVTSGTGNAFASLMVGAVANATVGQARGIAYRQYQHAAYIQDNWRVSHRLTANLGLRYDLQLQPKEKHDNLSNFDITRINPLNGYFGAIRYAGVDGEGSNWVRENWNDWGPRVGFALVLTSDNKTVMRGGYAIYYPTTAQVSYDQAAGNPNGFASLTTSYTAPTAYGEAFQFNAGVPYAPVEPQGRAGGQDAFLGQTGYYIFPTAKTPQSMQYTLTLSRELPFKTVLDISYLGNNGRHFNLGNVSINELDPSYFSRGPVYLKASVANPYAGLVPGSLGAATITRANLLKPFPYMQDVLQSDLRGSHFDGNFLYVTLQRRATEGLQFQGAYTYGKVMSLPIYTDIATTTGVTQTGGAIQNPRNFDGDYSVDAIDVTHRGVIAALYNLPFGKGHRFLNGGRWSDRLIGGFQFNATMTVESGRPLAFTGGGSSAVATRPNLDSSLLKSTPPGYTLSRTRRFNYAAFTDPGYISGTSANYAFGDAPRYYSHLRSPGVINFDMSVFKTTRITDNTSIELRLEAFNAFNHTNLGVPNTAFTAGAAGANTNNSMGLITTSLPARQVQLAAKLHF